MDALWIGGLVWLLAVLGDDDALGVSRRDNAVLHGGKRSAGIARHRFLQASTHQRTLRLEQRNGLPLHVGAHEGAVGVVVLQEGN